MKPSLMRRVSAAAAAIGAATAVLGLTTAAPSMADSYGTCPYPNVCFYDDQPYTGTYFRRYQDVTDYYQSVPIRSGRIRVWNTRNDDVAFVRVRNTSTGAIYTWCMIPNSGLDLNNNSIPTGIKIRPRSDCPSPGVYPGEY